MEAGPGRRRLLFSELPEADDSTDALGELPDGTLIFAAVSYTWPGERYTNVGWKDEDAYVIQSKDDGRGSTPPAKVNTAPLTWSYPYGRIVRLADGTLQFGLWREPLHYKQGLEP